MSQNINLQNLKSKELKWYEKNECAGHFWLRVTLVLVGLFYHPILRPILRVCVAFVTGVYFVFCPNERRNIARFYDNLAEFSGDKKGRFWWQKQWQIYGNFYEFGNAICDKIAAWLGKLGQNDIEISNIKYIKNELIAQHKNDKAESKKGQILVVSHFGNIEVCRALRHTVGEIPLVILMYEAIAKDFIMLLKNISQDKECQRKNGQVLEQNMGIVLIDKLDMDCILGLKDLVDSGVNIGIMGDRVAINNNGKLHKSKNAKFDFLGKSALFPQGAFLLSGILNAKISMLWCEKIKNKYHIELEEISTEPVRFNAGESKEAQIKGLMQKYVDSLQRRVMQNPKSWFNFYDFWAV